jgi:CHASE2 domain-containing sensor protein
VGRLVEKLEDNGVLVVGFDIIFAEPDRDIRDLLEPIDLDTLSREFIQTLEAIEPQINSDQYFADVMSRDIDVILAINFTQQTDALTMSCHPRPWILAPVWRDG